MPRAGLSERAVVAEAARLADQVGYQHLTLAAVAQRFGVALPSLYKHVEGLDGVQRALAARASRELTDVMAQGRRGKSRGEALRAMAGAYRRYARRHPGLYAATLRAPDPDDGELILAAEAALAVIYSVLADYGITGDDAIDATRSLRAALHGFVSLEMLGGFGLPRSVNRSFARLVDALDAALRSWSRPAAED